MALTNNGTQVLIPTAQLPIGYTKPTVTTFTDYEYEGSVTFTVAKSTVENATEATTVTALVAAVNTLLTGKVTADYIGTQTVVCYGQITNITTNQRVTADMYNDTVNNYLVTVKYFVKSS